MSECRICLASRKNVRSVFESSGPKNISYACMITSFTNVKISTDDGITDQICLQCRKKLKDAYEFKLLIDQSNTTLHLRNNSHLKRINFNNITDVKLEIDLSEPVEDKYFVKDCEDIKLNLIEGENSVCYNDTVISKVGTKNEDNLDSGPLSVIDFLSSLKQDPDNDEETYGFDIDDDRHSDGDDNYNPGDDDEYIPPKMKKKYSKSRNKKREQSPKMRNIKSNLRLKRVKIKPIYINDLKVLPTIDYTKKAKPNPLKKKPKNYKKKEGICPYCGKVVFNLNSHLMVHSEANFSCDKCDKKFINDSRLKKHQQCTHSETKDYKCDQCVAAFNNKASLRNHQVMHSTENKFVCQICSKSFKRNGALLRHIKHHNSVNKTYKCELCNMSFFDNQQLKHHMRVHTGERPFNCEICKQPYSYKHDFNRHCFKKHGIFLKRRKVYVMNEEVLARERLVMKDLMLKAHGIVKEGEPLIPFDEPTGALAFEIAMKTLRNNPLTEVMQF